jgi:hypothetical protein
LASHKDDWIYVHLRYVFKPNPPIRTELSEFCDIELIIGFFEFISCRMLLKRQVYTWIILKNHKNQCHENFVLPLMLLASLALASASNATYQPTWHLINRSISRNAPDPNEWLADYDVAYLFMGKGIGRSCFMLIGMHVDWVVF